MLHEALILLLYLVQEEYANPNKWPYHFKTALVHLRPSISHADRIGVTRTLLHIFMWHTEDLQLWCELSLESLQPLGRKLGGEQQQQPQPELRRSTMMESASAKWEYEELMARLHQDCARNSDVVQLVSDFLQRHRYDGNQFYRDVTQSGVRRSMGPISRQAMIGWKQSSQSEARDASSLGR